MYVDLHSSKHVTVKYVAAHTGHTLEAAELQFLPLPQSTKDAVSFQDQKHTGADNTMESPSLSLIPSDATEDNTQN